MAKADPVGSLRCNPVPTDPYEQLGWFPQLRLTRENTMKGLSKRCRGFTLPELMTSVAIVATLAAVQVPSWMNFRIRAKAAESRFNLAGIVAAEEAYFAQFGTYVRSDAEPPGVPGARKAPWAPPATSGFNIIGWAPEGSVYYQYEVSTTGEGTEFWAVASADIDNNTVPNQWGYVKPLPGRVASRAAAPGISAVCLSTGTFDPVTYAQNLLDTVGPCDGLSGASEF
jgi:prepilin-type N-terminal cleavage/methylation domain-containing protein